MVGYVSEMIIAQTMSIFGLIPDFAKKIMIVQTTRTNVHFVDVVRVVFYIAVFIRAHTA